MVRVDGVARFWALGLCFWVALLAPACHDPGPVGQSEQVMLRVQVTNQSQGVGSERPRVYIPATGHEFYLEPGEQKVLDLSPPEATDAVRIHVESSDGRIRTSEVQDGGTLVITPELELVGGVAVQPVTLFSFALDNQWTDSQADTVQALVLPEGPDLQLDPGKLRVVDLAFSEPVGKVWVRVDSPVEGGGSRTIEVAHGEVVTIAPRFNAASGGGGALAAGLFDLHVSGAGAEWGTLNVTVKNEWEGTGDQQTQLTIPVVGPDVITLAPGETRHLQVTLKKAAEQVLLRFEHAATYADLPDVVKTIAVGDGGNVVVSPQFNLRLRSEEEGGPAGGMLTIALQNNWGGTGEWRTRIVIEGSGHDFYMAPREFKVIQVRVKEGEDRALVKIVRKAGSPLFGYTDFILSAWVGDGQTLEITWNFNPRIVAE